MSAAAIRAEHLSKQYEIGATHTPDASLRDAIGTAVRRLTRRRHGTSRAHIWAVDDVSFAAVPGEVVGVIGRNGAGKSTLLRILSRITKPTSGYAEIRGRVGSLLEVGTGFHPDLTGRDNIFLNGAMLGMRKHEIERRLDEIVAFSGVERFIDTPVKRYSSGMHVRLAFAVAAHLEPEVLLVDEVLAVGDIEFQRKCLGKMQSVLRHGRTVMFVSHNMAAVKALCARVLLMDKGRITADGQADAVIDQYIAAAAQGAPNAAVPADTPRSGTGEARFRRVEVLTLGDASAGELYFGQRFRVRLTIEVFEPLRDAVAGIMIVAIDGTVAASCFNTDAGGVRWSLAPGSHTFDVDIDLTLLPRAYMLTVELTHPTGYDIDYVEQVATFTVNNAPEHGSDRYPWPAVQGYVRAASAWRSLSVVEQ